MIVRVPLVVRNNLVIFVARLLMSLAVPFWFRGMLTKTSNYCSVRRFQYVSEKRYGAEFETCTGMIINVLKQDSNAEAK